MTTIKNNRSKTNPFDIFFYFFFDFNYSNMTALAVVNIAYKAHPTSRPITITVSLFEKFGYQCTPRRYPITMMFVTIVLTGLMLMHDAAVVYGNYRNRNVTFHKHG